MHPEKPPRQSEMSAPEIPRFEAEQTAAAKSLEKPTAIAEQRAVLVYFRERLGVSQQALAGLLGVSLPSVSRYETQGKPLPFKVAAKLADLAQERGDEATVRWFRNYLSLLLKARVGIDAPLNEERQVREADNENQRSVLVLDEVLQLDWSVNPPVKSPANIATRERAQRLWSEHRDRVAPQKKITCIHCNQSDQTHRLWLDGKQWYVCCRCRQAEQVKEEER